MAIIGVPNEKWGEAVHVPPDRAGGLESLVEVAAARFRDFGPIDGVDLRVHGAELRHPPDHEFPLRHVGPRLPTLAPGGQLIAPLIQAIEEPVDRGVVLLAYPAGSFPISA